MSRIAEQLHVLRIWTRIEANFLTCFIALTILKVLHYKLGDEYSITRIIEALKGMKVKDYAKGYWETFEEVDIVEICDELGVD